MATVDDVREFAKDFPRSYEVVVRGRLKFRVGQIVWLAFSPDFEIMGFAHPKAWREALVLSDPDKFLLPKPSDLRFNWVCARLAALPVDEMQELVYEAWTIVVPKKVVAEYERTHGPAPFMPERSTTESTRGAP